MGDSENDERGLDESDDVGVESERDLVVVPLSLLVRRKRRNISFCFGHMINFHHNQTMNGFVFGNTCFPKDVVRLVVCRAVVDDEGVTYKCVRSVCRLWCALVAICKWPRKKGAVALQVQLGHCALAKHMATQWKYPCADPHYCATRSAVQEGIRRGIALDDVLWFLYHESKLPRTVHYIQMVLGTIMEECHWDALRYFAPAILLSVPLKTNDWFNYAFFYSTSAKFVLEVLRLQGDRVSTLFVVPNVKHTHLHVDVICYLEENDLCDDEWWCVVQCEAMHEYWIELVVATVLVHKKVYPVGW